MKKEIKEGPAWEWMMKWCKVRAYPPAQTWAWKYAKQAWKQKEKELKAIEAVKAEYSCWYCQLGMGSGRLSLRDIPEPPDWKDTLCEDHLDSITPAHKDGEDVTCVICGKGYKYKPWNRVVGRQDKRCYCKQCVSKFPTRHLDDDRLVEGEPEELDHLTNFEKTYEAQEG
jgi:hypothetical protein